MNLLNKIFTNSIIADWLVAIGTLLLAIAAFTTIIIGDGYSRLRKKEEGLKFKKISYKFLCETYNSWGSNNQAPKSKEMTVQENINNYIKKLSSAKIYLSNKDYKIANRYAELAKNFATAWDKNIAKCKNYKDYENLKEKLYVEIKKLKNELGK